MNGLIDIHCHILPGLDDGPESVEEALQMARLAVKNGVRTIVATPHCFDGVYNCQERDIVGRCETFNRALVQENIALKVLPGAEVRFTPELVLAVEKNQTLTLGGSCAYMLLELPELFIPDAVVMTIRSLQRLGVATILAHPERNSMLLWKPDVLDKLIRAGVRMQLTADSVLGGFGKESKNMVCQLLQMELPCYLGSDGHNTGQRKPLLAKAVKVAAREIGRKKAAEMVALQCENTRQGLRKIFSR